MMNFKSESTKYYLFVLLVIKPTILLERLSENYIRKMTMSNSTIPKTNKFVPTSVNEPSTSKAAQSTIFLTGPKCSSAESKHMTNGCTKDNRKRTENETKGNQYKFHNEKMLTNL